VLLFGGNAFGIRARQGRKYASAFEATQPFGSARMACLKVLVRTVCVLAALVPATASVWISSRVVPFAVLGHGGALIPENPGSSLNNWLRVAGRAVVAMSAYEQLALASVAVVLVAVMVACRASFSALGARNPRRMAVAGAALLLYGYVLFLLAQISQFERDSLGLQHGVVSRLATPVFETSRWVAVAAIALATLCLLWRSLAERLLTLRSATLAVLVSAAFAAAWVAVLHATGVSLSAMPTGGAIWMLSPALLPPLVSILAPWSLSRMRHT
jgi:hypothetical protein